MRSEVIIYFAAHMFGTQSSSALSSGFHPNATPRPKPNPTSCCAKHSAIHVSRYRGVKTCVLSLKCSALWATASFAETFVVLCVRARSMALQFSHCGLRCPMLHGTRLRAPTAGPGSIERRWSTILAALREAFQYSVLAELWVGMHRNS